MHLTNKSSKASDQLASDAVAADAGAPADEIEVTPEMLIAGGREMENYYLGDGRYCVQNDGLTAIYMAMIRAGRS